MPSPANASERIPINVASDIAKRFGMRQVVIFAWDGTNQHIVTFGKSIEDSDQAALGGDRLKAVLGWPESLALPSRVKKIQEKLQRLRAAVKHYVKVTRTRADGTKLTGWEIPAGRDRKELEKAEIELGKALL